MRNKVIQAINSKSDFICSVGEHIWKNPEPGYKEVKTSAYLVKIAVKFVYSIVITFSQQNRTFNK